MRAAPWRIQATGVPPPNGPLPAYMFVIASSRITSTPSNAITGNTVNEVIVSTNPGYGPQPSTGNRNRGGVDLLTRP
jgi:hypothetical protein